MEKELLPDERPYASGRRVTAENGQRGGSHAEHAAASTFTLRDLLAIGFRHQRLVVLSFLLTLSMAFVFVLLRPAQYEAQMKILVKHERIDPLVTSEESAQRPLLFGVTEEELNSEVELLKSRDLLMRVVVEAGLHEREEAGLDSRLGLLGGRAEETGEAPRIAAAVQRIAGQLEVQPLRRSNVIQVTYASPDPRLSAAVLTTLAERYLEKHLTVHRPSGAFDFFDQETERYGGQLALAQARLDEQNQAEGVVSVQVEREQALQRLGELEATEQATEAQVAETAARIQALERQLASTPARTTTEIRHGSPALLEQLHSTLVTYELKRIELRRVFQPDYPLVWDVEAQIARIQAAIDAAETSPLVEEMTDRNPTHDYLVAELAKGRSELAGLRARAAATARSLSVYRARARRLEELGRAQHTLVRAATQSEQNYVIYSRKREEARISNALDAQRILNVAIAEQATVPFEPAGLPRLLLLLIGVLVAGLVSVVLACAADYADPSFRTPDEVQAFLGSPALASIPRR
jgi:uncharacterized protein involved in exopolysaccharide biosynthesis